MQKTVKLFYILNVTCGSDKYTFVNFQIKGTKYVPVKVSNNDWAAFSEAYAGKIIENGETLNCGSNGEGAMKKQLLLLPSMLQHKV